MKSLMPPPSGAFGWNQKDDQGVPFQTASAELVSLAREAFEEDIVAAAERIFDVKAVERIEKQKRESALATKYNALVYESLPAAEGKVKIRVLIERKTPIDTA